MSGKEIGGAVNRWEEDRWRKEVESKITLRLFSNKMSVGDEIYCNRFGAVILFQCRTNTLRWRQGFVGGAMDCPQCGGDSRIFCHGVRGA